MATDPTRDLAAHGRSVYNIVDFGAVGDGKAKDTEAIRRAIDACSQAGGGTVYFPPGRYLTGTMELRSNTTLYIDAGATILGSPDREDYPVVSAGDIQGLTGPFYSSLVKGVGLDNITIVGRGTIDGQGWNWWDFGSLARRWAQYQKSGITQAPAGEEEVFEKARAAATIERPKLLEFILCKNIRVEGITLTNSPMWTFHPLCCDNITVNGVTVINPADSPNTDGLNPESCSNVHISNCHIDVGDDCITVKAGAENEPFKKSRPCENITVTNCTMLHGHGGVVIGSEMSGGVRNVTISNCVFNDTDRGIRIKTRRRRGGSVQDVRVDNIVMKDVLCPFVINTYYRCGASPDDMSLFSEEPLPLTDQTPIIKNLSFSNITARNVRARAGFLYGLPEMPVMGITFDNVLVETTMDPTEEGGEAAMKYGIERTAGSGFFCRNVESLRLSNLQIETRQGSALTIENGKDVEISGLRVRTPHAGSPVVELRDVQDAFIHGCSLSSSTDVFTSVSGEKTESIVITGNNLGKATTAVVIGSEAREGSVSIR